MGDVIKVDLRKVVCKGVGRIHVYQGRIQWWGLMNTAVDVRIS
jgi:hypothetical protein